MNYDDYAIQARLFAMAFESLSKATTEPPETQVRIWAVARFYAGMIDGNESDDKIICVLRNDCIA